MSHGAYVDVGGVAAAEVSPHDPSEEVVYHIAHDLNAPVKALSLLADWIREDMDPALVQSPAVTQHLDDMKTQTARLQRMLKALLAYSRAARPNSPPMQVALRDLIAETVERLGLQRRFVVRLALGVTHLHVPRDDFAAMLEALIDNAGRHHDKAHGMLTITSHAHDDRVCLRLTDDGPGIAQRYHQRIFDLMTTLQPRDDVDTSGVGLALARKVAVSMGGSVQVTSSEHRRGSTFEVVLPTRHVASLPMGAALAVSLPTPATPPDAFKN